jgi:hypothetical protein
VSAGSIWRSALALAGLAGLWASPAPAQPASLATSESFELVAAALGAGGGELAPPGSRAAATVEVTVGQASPIGVTRAPASGSEVEVEMGLWHVAEPSRGALGLAALLVLAGLGRRKRADPTARRSPPLRRPSDGASRPRARSTS